MDLSPSVKTSCRFDSAPKRILSLGVKMLIKFRQYIVAIKKFNLDKGTLNASALTFYTMFALVPILAAAIGIARGFGLDEFLRTQISNAFVGQESVILFLNQYADNLLTQSTKEIVAGVAVVVLFYSIYSMLSHIEHALNEVWRVSDPRKTIRRINNYMALILIAPIILVLASSIKILIIKSLPDSNILLLGMGHLLSFLLVISLFYWFYKYIPNIKVNASAALFAGVHAGLAYFALQSILIKSQLFITNYNTIYGSLAALPLFLIWVQASWMIVLFGAQLSFVYQYDVQALWEVDLNNLSVNDRNSLYIKVIRKCSAQFNLQQPILTAEEISKEINVPLCITRQLLQELLAAGLLISTISNSKVRYLPAQNAKQLSDDHILGTINSIGVQLP